MFENNLSYAHQYLVSLVKNLRNTDPNVRNQALLKLEQYMTPLGALINNIIKSTKTASNKFSLITLADYLDENGFFALADKVDEVIKLANTCGYDTNIDSLISLADNLDKKNYLALAAKIDDTLNLIKIAEEQGGFFQPRSEGFLSSRYCPDHRGTQVVRIADNVYQCPLDGKQYDYQSGYVNYKGETVVGGDISAQTPTTSDYGGIPMRFYDSRSDVLNRIN